MQINRSLAAVSAALVLLAGLVSCGRGPEQSVQSKDDLDSPYTIIHGAGATFPAPLYARWMEQYKHEQPDVEFSYDSIGSGAGIKRFIAQDVDFGASDAAMNDEEIARVDRGAIVLPMTAGMVVLAYNIPGMDGELRLSREAYVGIFSGEITEWSDPRIAKDNPGLNLPGRTIGVVVRRDSSGTTYAFTNHLSAVSETWRGWGPGTGKQIDWPGSAMTAPGNEGVAQKVRISDYSIGYMEYGFARRLGLPMVALENRAGRFVKPGPASGAKALAQAEGLAAADDRDEVKHMDRDLRLFVPDPQGSDSYPIVSLSWILLYKEYPNAKLSAALKQAMRWGLSATGQGIAEEMGYIPLPDNLVTMSEQVLEAID